MRRIVVAAGLALALAGCGTTGDPSAATEPMAETVDTSELEAELAAETARANDAEKRATDAEAEAVAVAARADKAEERATEAEAQMAAATEEVAPEPVEADEPEEAAAPSGEAAAGNYTFADIQISRDFIDDFEVRARVTNTGSTQGSVAFTATIFRSGSVVATAIGTVSNFEAGSTVTVEFMSTDDYQDGHDDVEFQVEYEF